jgi:hypothetical protein
MSPFSLDRIAEAEAIAGNPKLLAALYFASTCQVKADTQAGERRDHRAGGIGLHCVVDSGVRQQSLKRNTALSHRLEVNDDAGCQRHMPGEIPIDPCYRVHCGANWFVGGDL